MKQTIVFFDIDGVIFDAQKFSTAFYEKFLQKNNLGEEETEKLQDLYGQVKNEKGFFDPQIFLAKIASQYSIVKKDLEKLWWDEESFQKCLLIDENLLEKIREKATVGIFSKGEINFQKKKIEKFNSLINPQDIYIFEDKIVKISEVLAKYQNYKIFVVDDNQKVLEGFKQMDSLVFTVLVQKEKSENKDVKIDAVIANLSEIIPLLPQ